MVQFYNLLFYEASEILEYGAGRLVQQHCLKLVHLLHGMYQLVQFIHWVRVVMETKAKVPEASG